jgi:hypothetical protein
MLKYCRISLNGSLQRLVDRSGYTWAGYVNPYNNNNVGLMNSFAVCKIFTG